MVIVWTIVIILKAGGTKRNGPKIPSQENVLDTCDTPVSIWEDLG